MLNIPPIHVLAALYAGEERSALSVRYMYVVGDAVNYLFISATRAGKYSR